MNKVFLGGSIYGNWRNEVITALPKDVEYFDPIVENWTPECKTMEDIEKEKFCNIHLYVINSAMTGVFSIAEAVDSTHIGKKTIFQVIPEGFTKSQLASLQAVIDLINLRGGYAFIDHRITACVKHI